MRTRFLVEAAVIAAVYAGLTLMLAPLSYGPMQVRISEALTVLPALTPAAIPGLFVGCFVANIMSPYGVLDIVCGSAATLLAACGTWLLRDRFWLTPLPPVVTNGIIIGAMLHYAYSVPLPLWSCILWVALGEFLACYCLGLPLLKQMEKRRSTLGW